MPASPSPGVIASYRKGQYHVHATEQEWKVHLDRYDPKEHPALHLVDDAPLVFMITGTFNALLFESWSSLHKDPEKVLQERRIGWQLLIITGLALIFIGIVIALNPWVVFKGLIGYLIPTAIAIFGALMIYNGLRVRPLDKDSLKRISLGLGVLAIGMIFLVADFIWLTFFIMVVLAFWAFASAFVSLKRTAEGPKATPEGFYKRLAMGIISLVLGLLIILAPRDVASFLILILGILAILIGVSLIINGVGLRNAIRLTGVGGESRP